MLNSEELCVSGFHDACERAFASRQNVAVSSKYGLHSNTTIMNWKPASHDCRRACPWVGTERCAVSHIHSGQVSARRVSLGVICGLKAYYFPHHLPPCISADGTLNLENSAKAAPLAADLWE